MLEAKVAAGTHPIELDLKDRFTTSRRNLLWVSMLTCVISISTPTKIDIPGLGSSVHFSPILGITLLFAATIYCFVEFWPELQFAKARNSAALRDKSAQPISSIFLEQQGRLKEIMDMIGSCEVALLNFALFEPEITPALVEDIKLAKRSNEAMITEYESYFVSAIQNARRGTIPGLISTFRDTVENDIRRIIHNDSSSKESKVSALLEHNDKHVKFIFDQYDHATSNSVAVNIDNAKQSSIHAENERIDKQVQYRRQSFEYLELSLQGLLDSITVANERFSALESVQLVLAKDFSRLSSSIHGAHRWRFRYLDNFLPWCLLVFSGASWIYTIMRVL